MNESEEEKQRIRIFRKRIEKREFWTTATGFQKDLFQTHVADLWSTQAESTLRMLNWSSVPGLPEKHALAIHDQIIRTLAVIAQNHTALSRSKESHTRLITELYYARFLLEQLR